MKLGFDLDNVCCDTTEKMIEYINERVPVNLSLEDIKEYYMEKALPDQYKWIIKNGFESKDFWKTVEMIDGAATYLTRLYYERHEIYFCTSSLPQNLRKKINFIQRNLPLFPDNYVEEYTINIRNKQLLKLDYLVDDCLDNLIGERDYISICYDYPWNRSIGDNHYNFRRVKNWEEIYNIIRENV